MQTMKTSDVVLREDCYPRLQHNQAKVQEYAENIEHLPPIEVNQHNELIDGFHRWTAHKLRELPEIAFTVTQTKSDNDLLALAIQRNAAHGLQLSQADKRKMAIRFYATREYDKPALAKLLSVAERTIREWVSDLDKAEREERRNTIRQMYLQCYTIDEIAAIIGVTKQAIDLELSQVLANLSFRTISPHPFTTSGLTARRAIARDILVTPSSVL